MPSNKYGITVLHQPESRFTTSAADEATENDSIFCHEADLDLVAIHGLNGDAINTWTHKESEVMWLRDLLPKALPNARIMTFGYNARFKNFTAHQDLRGISLNFLAGLSALRKSEEQKSRPIILICHSLGGIVAKKAMLIGCADAQKHVQHSIYGVMFLGTPHEGTSLASLGRVLANIVSAFSPVKPARTLLGVLRIKSDVLLDIAQDFVRRRRKLHMVSFYEMEMTRIAPFLSKLIVEYHSAILNLPEETTVGQFSDHRGIARFVSEGDKNFQLVLESIKSLAESIEGESRRNPLKTLESTSTPGKFTFNLLERSIPLDISIVPCISFQGRHDVLNKMQNYFYEAESDLGSRKTFAICGLGGSGKTQIALRFLFKNLLRYKTGVMFLNATSTTTLNTDFARLHELLNLDEAVDKTASVKRWLSKQENSNWLMVFDNADDLSSVSLAKFFPAVSWGHIIVTSRDQNAIGGLTEQGFSVGPIGSHDAMTILMDKAGIVEASGDELQTVKEIISHLGSLPLALDQAGAFMRSRRKSPKEYLDLYLSKRDALLQLTPNLRDSEKTILTAWELNFKQVEEDSSEASSLLLLFCFLDSSAIPEIMLRRGSSPQKRWGANGEIVEVAADMEGVDESLQRLIQSELDFDTAIEKLLSFSLITCNTEKQGLRKFSTHPLVQYCAVQRVSSATANFWRIQAILLVCHAFPRSRYLEQLDEELRSAMVPHLLRILSEHDKLSSVEDPIKFPHELATTILVASRFLDKSWKFDAIERAKDLLDGDQDPYMNAYLTNRSSSVFRMTGMRDKSDQVLQEFIQSTVLLGHDHGWEKDPRHNALRGELIISYSQNLIRQGKLHQAENELSEWSALDTDHPSTLEKINSRARDITLGKILRFQGKFTEALQLVEKVLENSHSDNNFEGTGWYRVLVSGVAELYCELGREEEAESLLLGELEPMTEKGTQDVSNGRRLQRSLAETYIGRRMFPEAEKVLLHLKDLNTSKTNLAPPDNLGLYRIWVSLARVAHLQSHWNQALEYWSEGLRVVERVQMGAGFNAGLVRYSMAHAFLKTGDKTKSKEMLGEARENMRSESCIYWSPCFHSRWSKYIDKAMETENQDV